MLIMERSKNVLYDGSGSSVLFLPLESQKWKGVDPSPEREAMGMDKLEANIVRDHTLPSEKRKKGAV